MAPLHLRGIGVRLVVQSAGATEITIYPIYADEPEGYEIVKSAALNYSGTGWAGWSSPGARKVITGGGFQLPGAAQASFPCFPGQTTPFGYTYGSNEYGWLVQTGGTAGTGYIYAIYANRAPLPVEVFASDGVTLKSDHSTNQAAIDAASAGDIIKVAAGTNEENVVVNKSLTIQGPNHAISANGGNRVPEAIIQFPVGAEGGSSLFNINSDLHDVTIAGFDLRCQHATLPNYHYLITATYSSPTNTTEKWNNLTIRNNRMYSSEIPIYILTDFDGHGSGLLIEGNYINGGPNVNSSYNRGMYVGGTSGTIQDNVVENCNIGIQYMPSGNPNAGTIRRNTVSAALIGLYNNYQNLGAAPVTWEQNTVTVAPNDRSGLKAQVDGAWTNPVSFRGIHVITHGIQGTGNEPSATFQQNQFNLALSLTSIDATHLAYSTLLPGRYTFELYDSAGCEQVDTHSVIIPNIR